MFTYNRNALYCKLSSILSDVVKDKKVIIQVLGNWGCPANFDNKGARIGDYYDPTIIILRCVNATGELLDRIQFGLNKSPLSKQFKFEVVDDMDDEYDISGELYSVDDGFYWIPIYEYGFENIVHIEHIKMYAAALSDIVLEGIWEYSSNGKSGDIYDSTMFTNAVQNCILNIISNNEDLSDVYKMDEGTVDALNHILYEIDLSCVFGVADAKRYKSCFENTYSIACSIADKVWKDISQLNAEEAPEMFYADDSEEESKKHLDSYSATKEFFIKSLDNSIK